MQKVGDLAVRVTEREQTEHLALAAGESVAVGSHRRKRRRGRPLAHRGRLRVAISSCYEVASSRRNYGGNPGASRGMITSMLGRRAFALLVLVALLAATTALAARQRGSAAGARTVPIDQHVAMGAHLFVQFACSACHGLQGRGGVSAYVPA